jgi:pSer/pThr/pTyr-binding forkhead associated (FHA) protein
MMVTVGRAANNDIVLPYDSISKFHAYFSNVGNTWTLTDAKSTNGSFVMGRKLDGDLKEKLDLDKNPVLDLAFSNVVQCRLYTPDSFWDMAKLLLSALGTKK